MDYDQLQEALDFLRGQGAPEPRFGIILGTGLSPLAEEIDADLTVPYADIPHFPISTAPSHSGNLIFGRLEEVPVVAMAGRFHYYEGYSAREATFPVRVMAGLGIERLFISNAAGSVCEQIEAGDLVFVRDHINMQPDNPLRGPNDERLGPRFPDMLGTYDRDLNARALAIAREHGIRAHEGVYLALSGPNLETPAEYLAFHRLGADLIGMSTVPEVLVARHMDLPVFVVSVATNRCYPIEAIQPTSVEDVIAVANAAEPRLRIIVGALLRALAAGEG